MQLVRGIRHGGGARSILACLGALALVGLTVTGCTVADGSENARPAAVEQPLPIYANVTTTADVQYGSSSAGPLLLDVCAPSDVTASAINNGPLRAVVMVHGGSWRGGGKADPAWRSTCEWLASQGFMTFNVNYRLAPQHPFPAGLDDVATAVAWVTAPETAATYGYDPSLVGAFGGSAGGNLVAVLGSTGATGLAAVVDLSGPVDLTEDGFTIGAMPEGFDQTQLDYLGCAGYDDCAAAAEASPNLLAQREAAPFLIAHSAADYIPAAQGRALNDALRELGARSTFTEVAGSGHSIGILGADDSAIRSQIIEFLRLELD